MDTNTYITAHHLVKDYLPYFSTDIAKYIVKIYGQNNIIVLDINKKEIYNGDANVFFNKRITYQQVKKVIGATGTTEPLCQRVPHISFRPKPEVKVTRVYDKILGTETKTLSQQRNETLAEFKAKRIAKKRKHQQHQQNDSWLSNWLDMLF